MNAKTCAVEDILLLNKTKEYTLTATFLLDTILTDTKLNAHAAKLWQLLFSKAKFHPNLEIKISYIELGQILSKSIRTINRYIATLTKNGYLCKLNNYHSNGGQTINTLYIRFPQQMIEQAKQAKDRKCLEGVTTAKSLKTPTFDVNIDRGGDVTNGRHKDNIDNKNNNKNNNAVVCLVPKTNAVIGTTEGKNKSNIHAEITEVEKLKQHIATQKEFLENITSHRLIAEKAWLSERDLQQMVINQAKFGQLDATYQLEQGRLQQLEKKLQRMEISLARENKLTKDKQYISNREGKRVISPFVFKLLEKNLYAFYSDSFHVAKLLNEIIYEVRFGSLRFSKTTGTEISIPHAINIALKLVRECRWQTPADLCKT